MRIDIIQRPDFAKIAKNVRFGLAAGLTRTARQGQKAAIGSVKSTFTVRGNWVEPSSKFGIRITPATKAKPEALVRTAADWLLLHETGGVRRPRGSSLAIPTANVRRNKKDAIPRAQRPRNLKNTFRIETRRGPVLVQKLFANAAGKYSTRRVKTAKGQKLAVLYGLEKSARIRKQSTFFEPIRKVTENNLAENVREGIQNALRDIR